MFGRVTGGALLFLRFVGRGVSMSVGIGAIGRTFHVVPGCFENSGCLTRTV